MILPGATLGVLGGGQLGQMFALAARRVGYGVWVLDPDPDCPAAAVADRHLCAAYDDIHALRELTGTCAAVTTEFENVPLAALERVAREVPMHPGVGAVAIAQDRAREKAFFRDLNLDVAPFALLRSAADLAAAAAAVPFPAILKTARLGYDGKGQIDVASAADLAAAWISLGETEAVLEGRVALAQELSVILARTIEGMMVFYPVAENIHYRGVLDLSIVPARAVEPLQEQARYSAARIAGALDYVGVLAVEFFVDGTGQLLVNEMAPRPHNSGHFTVDACVHSQFDQQVRALCGLPLGDTRLISPVVMMNLLGDLWDRGGPDWDALLRHPQLKPHLYGKKEARPRRKMGHVNALALDTGRALDVVETLRRDWRWPN
ncbi:MAG: 5-(carboxyamino)imidazole ribonucleotide synthase [Acidithiobacillus ferrooxidans]|nr:5-(carboxyamino)imidazole ribonucleotide synthase [Acidithiobacillus ferrooxidans]MDD5003382.1 5-(carboxyamino)imidazole ribonucleotide synthase [Acidithiobacillus sp.]MDD5377725.1 5-(carboxyamino)imidazole ribonucleotide synthase [Acidithiobacillus sp.]MDD5575355.1 5-(carboxyamino)imidazole ribonucleotide synthase [Acidithiobacillus sp.]